MVRLYTTDLAYERVGDQFSADFLDTVTRTRYEIEHTGRDTGLIREHQESFGHQRGVLCRFDDGGAACRQGRPGLVVKLITNQKLIKQ